MSYNRLIEESLSANKIMALKLEEAIEGVTRQIHGNLELIFDGMTRLSYYTSCFTENYHRVCVSLKEEDVRFIINLNELANRKDVVFDMVNAYVEYLLKNRSHISLDKIKKGLMKVNILISTSQLTTASLSYAVAGYVTSGWKTKSIVGQSAAVIGKFTAGSLFVLTALGVIHRSAASAQYLHSRCPAFYKVLYEKNLEMLFFFIEPLIIDYIRQSPEVLSDDEIVREIMRLYGR